MTQIRDAIDRQDALQLKTSSHKLRGSLTTFAVNHAVQAAEELEMMGRTNEFASAEVTFNLLQEAVSRLRTELLVRLRTKSPDETH
jgi:HPt (histidine-containing phosphotransfer) domain-containing protein